MEIRSILRRHVALSMLDERSLALLVNGSEMRRLHRGSILWRAGDQADSLVVVGHGLVKELLCAPGARELALGLHGPGEGVGEVAVLHGTVHTTDALAVTDPAIVAFVPRELVETALLANGRAAMALARELGRHTTWARKRVALASASAEERLASTLIELAERFGDEMEDGGTLIPLRLTRAELAALVGTTVETTIRTLSRWSREGLVSTIEVGLLVHHHERLLQRSAPSSHVMTEVAATA